MEVLFRDLKLGQKFVYKDKTYYRIDHEEGFNAQSESGSLHYLSDTTRCYV